MRSNRLIRSNMVLVISTAGTKTNGIIYSKSMILKSIMTLKDSRAGQSLSAIFFSTTAMVIAVGISNPARSESVDKPLTKETAYEFNGRITDGYGSEVNADIAQLYRLFGTASDVDQQATAEGESSKAGWLGIGMRVPGQPPTDPETSTILQAIEVSGVMPYSAAEAVGLQVGDLIVGLDGVLIAGENVEALREFHTAINTKQPGEQAHLRIFRGEQLLELVATIKSYPHVNSELKPHPDLVNQRAGHDNSLLTDALAKEDLTIHFNRLQKAISKETDNAVSLMVRKDDYNPFRLQEVNYAMYHPLALPAAVRNSITDRLSGAFSQNEHDLNGLIQTALVELDMEYKLAKPNGKTSHIGSAGDFTGYIEQLVAAIQHAKQVREEVLSVLDSDEIDYLYQIVPGLLGSNLEQLEKEKNKAAGEEDKAQQEARTKLEKQQREELILRFLKIALKLDMPKLLNAATEVAAAIDLETLKKLRDDGEKLEPNPDAHYPDEWEVLEEENLTTIITPAGNILIGGDKNNTYLEDVALILDLGGNDKYFNHAGGSTRFDPYSVVIDLSGDDVYLSSGSTSGLSSASISGSTPETISDDFSQGAGFFGGGYLIDLEGNDQYTASNYSQGAAVFGIGILADLSGRDQYTAISASQGAAIFGAGILAEGGGNDHYFGNRFVQGMGYVQGFGAIVEAGGNDNYFAGGLHEDFRAPGKAYQSLSQGFGYGIRPDPLVGASGGIGVIAEASGNDTYVADYFAQGASYWFALGILDDRNGNDRYIAGRYSQGAGIHSSAGVLIDAVGDDNYLADFGVSQGCGHDYGIGFLLDNGGDDRYIAGTIAQGAGNANGIGVLSDNGGDDGYYLKSIGQGWGSFESVNREGSFGLLFDTGGGQDVYSEGGINGSLGYKNRWGLLLDTN